MKKCVICGKEFEPYHSRQKTCGDKECRRLHHLAYSKRYNKEHKAQLRDYKREYMHKKRHHVTYYKIEKVEKKAMTADGYAERQKAKLLAMAGRVEV